MIVSAQDFLGFSRNCADCRKLFGGLVWCLCVLTLGLSSNSYACNLCATRIPPLAPLCTSSLTAHAFGPPIGCHLLLLLQRLLLTCRARPMALSTRVFCQGVNSRTTELRYTQSYLPFSCLSIALCIQTASMLLKLLGFGLIVCDNPPAHH